MYNQTMKRQKNMKNIFLILISLLCLAPACCANSTDIALLTQKGFFDKSQQAVTNPYDEIKKLMHRHLKYSNAYDIDGLGSLYADNYINSDGFNKKIYFDLIKKTWDSYHDIRYSVDVNNIQVNGDSAVVQLMEIANATTDAKSGLIAEKGQLKSTSSSIYYLEKINNEWKITSDYIPFEKIYLVYGAAKNTKINLNTPSHIAASTPYTATLEVDVPIDTLVIASIGREIITYPQTVSEEVFRKLPENNCLERVFTSNNKNINEYAVASFGMTKAEIKDKTEIKIYITGLGFVMSRVNVIPANNHIKVEENEEK